MSDAISFRAIGAYAPGRTVTLFSHPMGYVAVTTALFAAGAYLGRDLSFGVGLLAILAALACLIGMRFALRRSRGPAPLLAASIFLDILNVFLFFLQLFSGRKD